jgi:hypothetical protein
MNQKDNKNIDQTEDQTSSHVLGKEKYKPDFTPDKEKIKGPSHASASEDKVEQGIELNEIEYNPFINKY